MKNNNKINIWTHNGSAHADEMLAISFLKAAKPGEYEIIRSDKAPDSFDIAIDVGGKYDGVSFFDHHQDDPKVNGKCSATLVAETFLPEIFEDRWWADFLKSLDIIDNRGLFTAPVDRNTWLVASQPVFALVKLFETEPDAVTDLLAAAVKSVIENVRLIRETKKFLEEHTEVETVDGINILVMLENPPEVLAPLVGIAQKDLVETHDIDVVYGYDVRSYGSGNRLLFRTERGTDKLDFSRFAGKENVIFAHKAGFLLIFRPTSEGDYIDYINGARL